MEDTPQLRQGFFTVLVRCILLSVPWQTILQALWWRVLLGYPKLHQSRDHILHRQSFTNVLNTYLLTQKGCRKSTLYTNLQHLSQTPNKWQLRHRKWKLLWNQPSWQEHLWKWFQQISLIKCFNAVRSESEWLIWQWKNEWNVYLFRNDSCFSDRSILSHILKPIPKGNEWWYWPSKNQGSVDQVWSDPRQSSSTCPPSPTPPSQQFSSVSAAGTTRPLYSTPCANLPRHPICYTTSQK